LLTILALFVAEILARIVSSVNRREMGEAHFRYGKPDGRTENESVSIW